MTNETDERSEGLGVEQKNVEQICRNQNNILREIGMKGLEDELLIGE